ncbi:hypothetical protein [Bifidobacterium simiarum]|uniref:hypothetical protein n=1 Tax=Bifidobacterium simiarum TaxID=2045441 RepID=UPI001BDD0017|nr:hypothetical protein [Bifidobacterium simiarum]MBT1165940.1 hypothetical protein [Bifidobacterium simiarum]
MFDVNKVRAIMARYPHIHPEDGERLDQYWKDLSDALLEDVDGYISFLANGCSANELVLLNEVNDELVGTTQSSRLVQAIRAAHARFPETNRQYHLDDDLDFTIRHQIKSEEQRTRLLKSSSTKN